MKSILFKRNFAILLLCVQLFLILGCDKKNELGFDQFPSEDNIDLLMDSSGRVSAFSVQDLTFPSSSIDSILLGSFFDPVFGKSTSDFLTQFRMIDTEELDTSVVTHVDSLVIYLGYRTDTLGRHYATGDTTVRQNLKVFVMDSIMNKDKIYYSNYTESERGKFYNSSNLIADINYVPFSGPGYLSIKLPKTLANSVMDWLKIKDFSNDSLMKLLPGFYFQSGDDPGNGAIVQYFLYSVDTRLTLHYSNVDSAYQYSFRITSNSSRVHWFNHSYEGSSINSIVDNTEQENDLFYVESAGGPKGYLRFPGLETWKDSGLVAVSSAELLIPLEGNNLSYPFPARLTLEKIYSDGSTYPLPQYSSSVTGEKFDSTLVGYRFNIGNYVQDIINGKAIDYGLYLFSDEKRNNLTRAILKSGKKDGGIKLKIAYSKLNETYR